MTDDGSSRRDAPGRDDGEAADRDPEAEEISLRPLERKILICGGAVLAGIALAGRFRMLPGAAVGGAIAYANFFLIRKILERAFAGGGPVRKGFVVQYVLKFLGLAALVYLVVRSGRFDLLGFLLGFSALFLGVLLEGLSRAAGER